MNKAKLSVIVPTYNTVEYLQKCIDSLVMQTIKEIEVIIINDCSTQNISPITNLYNRNNKVVFLHNETKLGPGASRNKGLEKASGEFIAFCDSDDWVDLDLFDTVVKQMEDCNADIGVFSILREQDGIKKPTYLTQFNKLFTLTSDLAIRTLSRQYNMGIELHNSCLNKVFRRSLLNKSNAKFEEGIYFQGILFNVFNFLYANKIICIPDVSYHHYRRNNSIVQSFSKKHILDFEECYKRMKGYFVKLDKFNMYKVNYYLLCENYMNLIVCQIFEFEKDEKVRKDYLQKILKAFISLVSIDDYFEYTSAEKIRQHVQPHIEDTKLY